MVRTNRETALIISTKHYPVKKGWECFTNLKRLGITDKWEELSWANFASNDLIEEFKSNPVIKTKRFGITKQEHCHVFVVPCLQNNSFKPKEKGKYLESVIELCSEDFDLNNIYVIAHDQDFVVDTGTTTDDFVKEHHIASMGECLQLKGIVAQRHAYMFQHKPDREVEKVIAKLDADDFNDNMCADLFEQVFGKLDMIDFFKAKNDNIINRYTE